MDILLIILPIVLELIKNCKDSEMEPLETLKNNRRLARFTLVIALRKAGYRRQELRRAVNEAMKALDSMDDDDLEQLVEGV